MPGAKIRCNYDEVQQMAQIFQQQNQAIAAVNRKLKSAQQTLEGGQWIGKGATAFYKEMNGEVMPSMKRLEKAMAEAARITKQIHQVMHQAEQEASSIFKL